MYRHHPSWVAVRELVASGRIGRLSASRAGSRSTTTTRRTSATSRTWAAARCGTSAATRSTCRGCCSAPSPTASRPRSSAIRRPGVDVLTQRHAPVRRRRWPRSTVLDRAETDQRVDIVGSDGRISIDIPFNIPPDGPTARCFVTRGRRPAGRARDRDADVRDARPVRRRRPSASRPRSSTAGPTPIAAGRRGREPAGHRAAVRRGATAAR